MTMVGNHLAYLAAVVLITVSVGRTLFVNGRPFLIDVFRGDARTADAVNRLLIVGFYLVNVALAALAVRLGGTAAGIEGSLVLLSTKIGWALAILGGMHLFNVAVLSAIRKRVKASPIEIVEFLDQPNAPLDGGPR